MSWFLALLHCLKVGGIVAQLHILMFWHGILFFELTDDRGKFVKSKWWCHASFSCVLHLWSSFYYCVYAYMAMGSINFLNSVVVSKVSFFVADNSNNTRHLFHYLEDLFCSNCRYISGNAFFLCILCASPGPLSWW